MHVNVRVVAGIVAFVLAVIAAITGNGRIGWAAVAALSLAIVAPSIGL